MHTCLRRYPAAVENARNSAADEAFRNDRELNADFEGADGARNVERVGDSVAGSRESRAYVVYFDCM